MHYKRTPDADDSASSVQSKFLTSALTTCLPAFALLMAMLIVPSAMAQSFIRFDLAQNRLTVPVNNPADSVVVTNISINLSGGATNANLDVSGLPAGAGYILSDTNGGTPLTSVTSDTNITLTVNTANLAEGLYQFRLNAGGLDTNGLPVTNSFPFILQAAHIWAGTLNGSNSWSDAASWSNGLPSATSDVVLGITGAQTNDFSDPSASGIPWTNSFVTADTIVGSLRFSQTGAGSNPPPIWHHVQISQGKTLTLAGTNGFSVMEDYFDLGQAGIQRPVYEIIDGAGAKMVVSNLNATIAINGTPNGTTVPTLIMSNLDTFISKVGRLGVSDYQAYPNYRDMNAALNAGRDTNSYNGRPRGMSIGTIWAKTNIFFAGFIDPQNYTNDLTRNYALMVFNNEQNGVGSGNNTKQSFIMGISNIFLADGVCFYGGNGNGITQFGPTNGSAIFRNTNGTSRMSIFSISDDGGTNAAGSNLKGTVDFSLGTVDLLVDRLYMSRDREQIATNNTPNVQSDLIVGKGTANINTAFLGFQEHAKPDWTVLGGGQPYLSYCQGRLVVTNGGTVRVNGTVTLGYTADMNNPQNAQQYNTFGRVTIYSNSVFAASNIVCDTGLNIHDGNGRQNTISINSGGNLVVTNSIGGPDYNGAQYPTFGDNGGPGLPLDGLSMQSGAILTLFVTPGKTNVYVRNLSSSGVAPGIIKIAALPSFPVYPTNISLISYTTATPVLAADMSSISGNVQGYILNNVANHTIDLFLTTNAPRSLVWTGGVNNQWDLSTANWVPLGGGAATAYSMGDIAIFNDSASVTNIDVTDTVVPNQQTNGVIITNTVNIFTFNSAGGSIAGTAKIVKQGTNDLNFNAIESGPITISAGRVNVTGTMGTMTLASNTVLNVMSAGSVAGVSATTANVNVMPNGVIGGGAVSLNNSLLINDGFVNIPSGTVALSVTNNSIVTNNADGTITIAGTSSPAVEIFPGNVLANFGAINLAGSRITVDGLYFGTGQIQDTANAYNSAALGRLQFSNTPGALLSPGAQPTNSIGNLYAGARLDMSGNTPQNTAPTFLVDIDTVANQYDTITAERWNNIGCIWKMNLLNGSFQSGQVFQILVNANGTSFPNFVDTAAIFPLMQPSVPGPGLQWNLSGVQVFGTVGVTNGVMVWDGNGNGSWDTNGSTGNWKSTLYGDNQGAIFDDTASGSTTVTLNSPVAPAGIAIVTVTNIVGTTTNVVTTTNTPAFSPGIVVSNALKDYTITTTAQTNRITGMTSIYKTGPGTLTLLASNDFTGGMIVEGGTVAFTNIAALGSSAGSKAVYDQIILNNSSLKFFASNTNQTLAHVLTLNGFGGTVEVSSNSALLNLNLAVSGPGALTKTGAGNLIMSQANDSYTGGTVVSAGTLRLTATAAGIGALTLSNNTTLELTNAFTLTNAINVAGSGTAVSLQGISTNVLLGAFTGAGSTTITGTNANRLLVFNNDLTGFSGTISFGASVGQFRFNNRTNDALSSGSALATFDLGTGSATLYNISKSNQVYDLGALAGGANTTLSGSSTNAGLAATTYSIGANGNSTTFAGKIVNGQDVVSVNKVGTGTLSLNGVNTYTGTTTVSGGTLAGTGSIAGPLAVQAGGTLAPGAQVGTFTVNNNATLGGSVVLELNQSLTPKNDELVVTGTIGASGSLVVTNVGPDINNGTKFTLFNKAVIGFGTVMLPANNPANTSAYVWQNDIGTDGSITLVSGGGTGNSVNTNPTNIVVSVSGNVMTMTWPGDHLGWQLLSNSVGLTATNQWFPITGSTSTTQQNLTIDPSKTNVFFRMTYPPLP